MKNIDDMTDEEIEAYLDGHVTETEPQGATGYGIVTCIAGLLAAFASVQLILAELALAEDPSAALKCDINPIVGCSTFLTSWQGHLLGISNSILGLVFFAGIAGVGLVLATGGQLTTLMWRFMLLGAAVSFAWLLFFHYESFFVSGTLCPWCMLIWVCLIPFIVHTLAASHRHGAVHLGKVGDICARRTWTVTACWYLVILVFIVVWFWSDWVAILG